MSRAYNPAPTIPEDPPTLPLLDTSLASSNPLTTLAPLPADVLTPLPLSPRRWWDHSPVFLTRTELRRRHTVAPRVRPRGSFRRRGSLRSIFSWRSGSSDATVKPEKHYHQSRFIEGLDRKEWGFSDEGEYTHAALSGSENSSASSLNVGRGDGGRRKGKARDEWPLSEGVVRVLDGVGSVERSPVDSAHSAEKPPRRGKGGKESGDESSLRVEVSRSARSRENVASSSESSPQVSTTELRSSGESGDERRLIGKTEKRARSGSKVVGWLGRKFRRGSVKEEEEMGCQKEMGFCKIEGRKGC